MDLNILAKAIGSALLVVAAFFLGPLLSALFGAFIGWVVGIFPTGEWVVSGAGDLGLQIDRANLWRIGSALGFFGAFFRSTLQEKTSK